MSVRMNKLNRCIEVTKGIESFTRIFLFNVLWLIFYDEDTQLISSSKKRGIKFENFN